MLWSEERDGEIAGDRGQGPLAALNLTITIFGTAMNLCNRGTNDEVKCVLGTVFLLLSLLLYLPLSKSCVLTCQRPTPGKRQGVVPDSSR